MKRLDARLVDFAIAWNLGLQVSEQRAPRFTPPREEPDPAVTLDVLLNLWARKKNTPCNSAVDDAKSVVRDVIGLFGDIRVADFTRDDFDFFADELRKLPAAMSHAERQLPFAERVKLGEDPGRGMAIDATTAKKIILLKSILAYAFKKKRIAYNLTQGLETGHQHQPGARRQMTNTEVNALFSLPIFSDPSCWTYDHAMTDTTIAWVGMIGLVSGSRLGEIAQAHIVDVLEDEGHVAISITTEEDRLLPPSAEKSGPAVDDHYW